MYFILFRVELLNDAPNLIYGISVKQTRQILDNYGKSDLFWIFRSDVSISDRYHGCGGPIKRIDILNIERIIIFIKRFVCVCDVHDPIARTSANSAIFEANFTVFS